MRFPTAVFLALLFSIPLHAQTVLVFSKTAGFRHDSIPNGIAAVEALGAAGGFDVEATEDAGRFTDAGLAPYAAVVFLSTTGNVLNDDQQAAFERYVQAGGGFVGVHAAADTEYDWPWYGGLVGAYFQSHPPGTAEALIRVADRVHPSTGGLPSRWTRTDEWYNFRQNPRGNVHVLATLDETTFAGGTHGEDHPIAWCHAYDGGRAWYTALGHTTATYNEPLFRDHLLGGIRWAAGLESGDCGATVPGNYERTVLDADAENPIELAVMPDGRVLYIERDGRLKIHRPASGTTVVAGQLDVTTEFEDGLIGLTLDPSFADTGWLYLFYSPAGSEAVQHVSRFTLAGGVLDLDSEQRILEIPTQRQECCHSGGSLTFDADGNLFIATGDNTNPFASDGYAPIDERPGRSPWDAQKSSANPNDLRGKILRITPLPEGGYAVPEGNLFPEGTPGTRPEIYIMGTRNPYRITADPATGWLYWGDVGPDAQNDNPSRGPRGYDEWNQARSPGNYGWPYCIADNIPYRDYNFATSTSGPAFDCAAPVNTSPNNTGATNLPPARPAWIWYPYGPSAEFPAINVGSGGRTAMAGPVYHFDEATADDSALPPYFDGTLFIYEWSRNWIKEVKLDENGDLLKINPFLPGLDLNRPIEMEIGPDGAIYMLEWGTGFGGNNDDARLIRIDYVRGSRSPVARLSASPTDGPLPLTVAFSSAGSFDPDPGDAFTYAWDFDGDGTVDTTDPDPTFTYTTPGTYTAVLILTDADGKTGTASLTITAGNSRPVVTLAAPVDGGFYEWGETVAFAFAVDDPEDGATTDGTLPCTEVVFQPRLGHDDHTHPLGQFEDCAGTFETGDGDHGGDGANLFLAVEATYTDAGAPGVQALTGRALNRLQLKRKQAEHFSSNNGVLLEDTGDVLGGAQNIGWIDHGDHISFTPMNLQGIDFVSYRVASAGPGGRIEVRADAPDGELLSVAFVEPTGAWQTYRDVTAPIRDPGGTRELFFVFKRQPNDGGLFNVNWIDFHGLGVVEPRPDRADGLLATYFSDPNLTTPTLVRIDPLVNFNWATTAPAPELSPDNFSVRWTGLVQPPTDGRYRFYVRMDDGARLWIDGELVLDAWTDGSVREVRSDAVTLEADRRYPITLEYYENGGEAQAHLSWSAAGLTKQTVPRTALFSNSALPTDAARDDAVLPRRLDIEAVYPSPTAGSTRIRFGLPDQADVRLEAFDMLGRRVATLAEGAMRPGTHDVTFDSRTLPNGVYLLRLSAGGTVRTRSLVVAR